MDIELRDQLYAEIVELEKSADWNGIVERCLKIADLTIPDLEKSTALANAANSYGQLGNSERALYYFDKAIYLESKHKRFSAIERKASFLADQGRLDESLAIYRDLKAREDLFLADIQRYTNNITVLEQKIENLSE